MLFPEAAVLLLNDHWPGLSLVAVGILNAECTRAYTMLLYAEDESAVAPYFRHGFTVLSDVLQSLFLPLARIRV